MKSLLNNQNFKIENHQRQQITKGLKNLHIHKTKSKDKDFKKAVIKIPLDGRAYWELHGENAEELEKEFREALADRNNNRDFVNEVIRGMNRYNTLRDNPDMKNEEQLNEYHRKIAENILSNGFKIYNLTFLYTKTKIVYGHKMIINFFENTEAMYSSCLGKTWMTFRGITK